MLKQKRWVLRRRTCLYLGSQEMKNSVTKFKGSVFAVIFGLLIAAFVILGSEQNPFTYFQFLFLYAFTSWPSNNWDNTLVWWAIYIVAGLAVVVSFRTGMFNIGVAGQMLAAGAVVLTIGIRYNFSQPVYIIVALIAGVLAAMLVAIVTALLKVCFNVHEVVTSILLNWTIWYLIKWLFKRSKDLYNPNHGTSAAIHDKMTMIINGYNFILPLFLALILVLTVWFLLKKTILGYKIRTVGLNPFAAVYAGISDKRYAVISFALSGALAGVMAVIYYIAKNPSISFFSDDLPSIGFDSIAVALVGQINAVGVVGAAFIWGLIKSSGSICTIFDLPAATGDIIFGVIIYSAACAILLSRLQPIKFLIRYINILVVKAKRNVANSIMKQMYGYFKDTINIKKIYRQHCKELKKQFHKAITVEKISLSKTDKQRLWQENNEKIENLLNERNDKISVCWAHFFQSQKKLSHYINKQYNNLWKKGKIGRWNSIKKQKKIVYAEMLNTYISEKIAYEAIIYDYKQELLQKLTFIQKQKFCISFLSKNNENLAPPLINSKITKNESEELKKLFKQQVHDVKAKFNTKFHELVKTEQQAINNIKPHLIEGERN